MDGIDPNLLLAKMDNRGEFANGFNNPLMYLIWLYAFRWLGGFGFGLNGENQQIPNAAFAEQLSNIRSLTQSIAQSINDGKFTQQQIQDDLRTIQSALCQGFGGLNTEILRMTNAIENQISECCCEVKGRIDAVGTAVKENAYIIKDAVKDSIIASDKNFCALGHALQDDFCKLNYNLAQQFCDVNANATANTRALMDVIRAEGIATREQCRGYRDEAVMNELNTYKTKANNAELLSQMEKFIVAHYTPNTGSTPTTTTVTSRNG